MRQCQCAVREGRARHRRGTFRAKRCVGLEPPNTTTSLPSSSDIKLAGPVPAPVIEQARSSDQVKFAWIRLVATQCCAPVSAHQAGGYHPQHQRMLTGWPAETRAAPVIDCPTMHLLLPPSGALAPGSYDDRRRGGSLPLRRRQSASPASRAVALPHSLSPHVGFDRLIPSAALYRANPGGAINRRDLK